MKMDTYQAVYDAVRSKIPSCDTTGAIERALRDAFDMGNLRAVLQQEFCIAAGEMARPSAIYRPDLSQDGDKWCALYGDDLVHGIAGFGDTPDKAMSEFDQAWLKQKTAAAIRAAR